MKLYKRKSSFSGMIDLPAREAENGWGSSSLQTLLQVHDIAAIEHHVAFLKLINIIILIIISTDK